MAKLKEVPQMNDGTDDQPDTIISYSVNIAEQERPPILPVGEYRATITGVEKKYGKDSGRPYLRVKYLVDSDDQPADFVEQLGSNQGVTLSSMVFGCEDIPQSRFNMQQFCIAVGAPMSHNIDVRDFIGQECRVMVDHEKDLDGNPRPQVRRVSKA